MFVAAVYVLFFYYSQRRSPSLSKLEVLLSDWIGWIGTCCSFRSEMCFFFVFSAEFAAKKSFKFGRSPTREYFPVYDYCLDFTHLSFVFSRVFCTSCPRQSVPFPRLRPQPLELRYRCFALSVLLQFFFFVFFLVRLLPHCLSGDVFFLSKRDALHRLSKCTCRDRLFASVGQYLQGFLPAHQPRK